MLQVEKILNAGNYELVVKWSDGMTQHIAASTLQENCPCVCCTMHKESIDPRVKILSFNIKGRLGIQIRFSSGCQKGIYSFNQIRAWLKKS